MKTVMAHIDCIVEDVEGSNFSKIVGEIGDRYLDGNRSAKGHTSFLIPRHG
jgi:hypothetical protein